MNDFQPTPELIAQVKIFEGLVLVPRPDPVGKMTGGYGHKYRPGEHVPAAMTEEQADLLLAADLHIAAQEVRALVTVELTQAQFDGICDWVFNLGAGNLQMSEMLQCINAGKWTPVLDENEQEVGTCAQTQCLRWDHNHAGAVLPGLYERRVWDAAMMAPTALDTSATEPPVLTEGVPDEGIDPAEPTPQQIEADTAPATETPAVP